MRHLQSDRRFRSSQEQFVVEGTRWVQELVGTPVPVHNVFYTATWLAQENNVDLLERLTSVKIQVADEIMAAMSATETPPGILATVAIAPVLIPTRPSFILILDGMTNPGNLGTVLRTAAAAGVGAVLLSPGCVDVYNPKVVRGSMGALLRLPVHQLEWQEIAALVKPMQVWVAAVDGATAYSEVDWRKQAALIIGSEAHGAGAEARNLAGGSVYVPMSTATESLNAAIAAGIIIFEAARQRDSTASSSR